MRTDLLIAVDDDHVARLGEVVERLRAAGMDVEHANDLLGTVTGSIDEARVSSLESVDGVVSVEHGHRYELPPPDAPVQ